MFGMVLGRFAGIVIMDRTVIHVVMTGAVQMVRFMGKIECIFQWRPSALHREAVQGQKQQKKNAKETAHGQSDRGIGARLYQFQFICHVQNISQYLFDSMHLAALDLPPMGSLIVNKGCHQAAGFGDTDVSAILVFQMNHFYKTFLLWLLVALLPLHAAAGAMSMSCGPIHQQAMQVASMDDAHHHHDDSDPSHSHHHDAAKMTNAAADASDAGNASSETHPHANCTACTATCIGAAAPPSALFNATPVFNGSEMVTVSPASLAIGVTPSGLERPPKHILA